MGDFFGAKKVTMEFTPEEYEMLKKEAMKKGMSIEVFLKTYVRDKAAGQDLDKLSFRIAKQKLFEKDGKTLKKLADL